MNDLTIVTEAQQLHQDIMIQEQVAAQSLTQIACDLKQMRDRHLYTHLGYNDFEEYCEKATKTGKRQAYNLISLVEAYKIDGLNRLGNLGSTKLLVLKNLSPEEREELIPEAEELSVRELKERIKELTDKNKQLSFELSELADKPAEKPTESKYTDAEWDALRHTAEQREKRIEQLEDEALDNADELKAAKKKLEDMQLSMERQLTISEQSQKKAEELTDTLKSKIAGLERELEAERKKPVEVAVAEPSAEDIAKIKAEAVKEAEATAKAEYDKRLKSEIEKVKSISQPKAAPSGNKELLKYRLQNIQTEFNEAIELIKRFPVDEQDKCRSALMSVIEQIREIVGGNE